ncbi:MAG: YtxH domain-containing protein [Bacteroidota bacterium]
MNTTSRIIAGFLLGTAIGTLTGLLFAPKSGKSTRKDIGKRSKKLARQVADYVSSFRGEDPESLKPHVKNGKPSVETT